MHIQVHSALWAGKKGMGPARNGYVHLCNAVQHSSRFAEKNCLELNSHFEIEARVVQAIVHDLKSGNH